MDWDTIRNELAQAVQRAFADFRAGTDSDQLYALCLSASEGGMGIGLNANTEFCFNEKLSSESLAEEITPQYESYLRWSPAEWGSEGIGDDGFQPLNDALTQAVLNDALDESSLEKLVDAMIAALCHFHEAQGDTLKGVTLFVTITDSDDTKAIEDQSAIIINAPDVGQALISRLG